MIRSGAGVPDSLKPVGRHPRRERLQHDPVSSIREVAPEVASELTDGSLAERIRLARDPKCPEKVIDLLVFDRGEVVAELAKNPSCTARNLATIVAMLPFAGPDVDDVLYHRASRHYVARHPNCSAEVLEKLSGSHADSVVRNPSCPPEILAEYCEPGWGTEVTTRAAAHPSTPTASLLTLIASGGPGSAEARAQIGQRDHLSIRAALLSTDAVGRREILGGVDAALERDFAQDHDARIRYAVACTSGDATLLGSLSRDPQARVRRAASSRILSVVDG